MWYSYLQYDVLASLLAHERSRFAICVHALPAMIQLRINPVPRQQLLVCAFLLNPVRCQHKDASGIPYRREPVRDDEGRPPLCQLFH